MLLLKIYIRTNALIFQLLPLLTLHFRLEILSNSWQMRYNQTYTRTNIEQNKTFHSSFHA